MLNHLEAAQAAAVAIRGTESPGAQVRLDIGCGDKALDGWIPIDRKFGKEAFPLDYPTGSVDAIRAVHILEHFSYFQTISVLKDWCRVLKPGGLLRVAVPDLDKLIAAYQGTNPDGIPIEQCILGAQSDPNDIHKALFNAEKLTEVMQLAGFGAIRRWKTKANDCASLSISLNLEGKKGAPNPVIEKPLLPMNVAVALSVPRLGFQDTFLSICQSVAAYRLPVHRFTGAFWGQCLERSMKEMMGKGFDAIITIDYDSVFAPQDIATLVKLLDEHPEADAICSMQICRGYTWPLITKAGPDGKAIAEIDMAEFTPDLTTILTGHFGLTIIRTEKLKRLPHPWFLGVPNEAGEWGENRIDEDIYFWKKWQAHGFSLYHANRVPIGHADLTIQWPGFSTDPALTGNVIAFLQAHCTKAGQVKSLTPKQRKKLSELLEAARYGRFDIIHQRPSEYWDKGKPPNAWR